MEKTQYEALEIEAIELGGEDVIATSCGAYEKPEEEAPELNPFGE